MAILELDGQQLVAVLTMALTVTGMIVGFTAYIIGLKVD